REAVEARDSFAGADLTVGVRDEDGERLGRTRRDRLPGGGDRRRDVVAVAIELGRDLLGRQRGAPVAEQRREDPALRRRQCRGELAEQRAEGRLADRPRGWRGFGRRESADAADDLVERPAPEAPDLEQRRRRRRDEIADRADAERAERALGAF